MALIMKRNEERGTGIEGAWMLLSSIEAIAIVLISLIVAAMLSSCARVPVPGMVGREGRPAYAWSVGGRVQVTTPEASVTTDHTESWAATMSFADKAATKYVGWKIFARGVDRLDTRDTIEASSQRATQANQLDTLRETNRHTQAVQQAEQAFQLEQAAIQ